MRRHLRIESLSAGGQRPGLAGLPAPRRDRRPERLGGDASSVAARRVANLIWRPNQVGLARDAAILRERLEESGYRVRDLDPRSRNAHGDLLRHRLRGWWSSSSSYPFLADVNLHLEKWFPRWRWTARVNALVPNPEWCPRRLVRCPRSIDLVLCKTEHAGEIFSDLGCRVEVVGFTSFDRRVTSHKPDYASFFHLAGRSRFKGTETLVELWGRHPEWPTLILVQNGQPSTSALPPNIDLRQEHLPDDELEQLQNRNGIHLYPSRCEGWGHAMVEAMSCEAVVVTNDAPPMNEIVRPDRGLLVPWNRRHSRRLGTEYLVDARALEQTIERLLEMPREEKRRLGHRGRAWFEWNHCRFEERFRDVSGIWLSPRNGWPPSS